jgi:hypothetical protein
LQKLIFVLLLAVLSSCQDKTTEVKPVTDTPYFSPREVLAGSLALTAMIDWPKETTGLQKNLNITPEEAQTLMLPMHPLWDEKGAEVLAQMSNWDKTKVQAIENECKRFCECDFYLDLISRHPEILSGADPAFIAFSKIKYIKEKADILRCLDSLPSVQNVLNYLKKELTNYQADSVL